MSNPTLEDLVEFLEKKQLARIERGMEIIMGRLDAITDALGELGTQLTQLADQVAAMRAAEITDAELQAVADGIRSAANAADAIVEPDAGEEPVV